MNFRRILAMLAASWALTFSGTASASLVTVDYAEVNSYGAAFDGTWEYVSAFWNTGLGIPLPTVSSATGEHGVEITNTINSEDTDAQYSFDVLTGLQRGGNVSEGSGSYASSYITLYFTPNESLAYSASGFLGFETPSDSYIYMYAQLYDYTASEFLFFNQNWSDELPAEMFILGSVVGDVQANFGGSLSGTLTAGHSYGLQVVYQIQNSNQELGFFADSGASATGGFNLTLTPEPNVEPPAVPEPSSLALCGMGALALGWRGLRRRQPVASK